MNGNRVRKKDKLTARSPYSAVNPMTNAVDVALMRSQTAKVAAFALRAVRSTNLTNWLWWLKRIQKLRTGEEANGGDLPHVKRKSFFNTCLTLLVLFAMMTSFGDVSCRASSSSQSSSNSLTELR